MPVVELPRTAVRAVLMELISKHNSEISVLSMDGAIVTPRTRAMPELMPAVTSDDVVTARVWDARTHKLRNTMVIACHGTGATVRSDKPLLPGD